MSLGDHHAATGPDTAVLPPMALPLAPIRSTAGTTTHQTAVSRTRTSLSASPLLSTDPQPGAHGTPVQRTITRPPDHLTLQAPCLYPIGSAHTAGAAGAGPLARRYALYPQPAAGLHTSEQGSGESAEYRVLYRGMAAHALPTAPGIAISHHGNHMHHHSALYARQPQWQRAEHEVIAAAEMAASRARSKAPERAVLRPCWPSGVRGAAYI